MVLGLAVLALLFAVAVLVLFRARPPSPKPGPRLSDLSPFGLIADPEKLERAEAEARNFKRGDLVVAGVFRSDQGHDEASLASLIIFLGSQGVDATYDVSTVGLDGGALLQFTLKVPPAQLEKTRILLRGKFASG